MTQVIVLHNSGHISLFFNHLLTFANLWVFDIQGRVLVEALQTGLAVGALGVVHAVFTNAASPVSGGLVQVGAEVALCGVFIAFTFCNDGEIESNRV